MSLLTDIQEMTVDSGVQLSDILRKCLILAARLKHEDFKVWVERELNGYPNRDELPPYRIIDAQSHGHFSGPFGSQLKNAPIPLLPLGKEIRDTISKVRFQDPIATYCSLIAQGTGQSFRGDWPSDLIAMVGDKFYEDMTCLAAWQVVPYSKMVALVEAVRNRVLQFVLDLHAEFPDAGEGDPSAESVSPSRIAHIYNTTIMGSVANLAQGSQRVAQYTDISVQVGDLDGLRRCLADAGVDAQDWKDLESALGTEREIAARDTFGPHVSSWIGRMVAKAASGTWKIASAVAAKLLSEALSKYYGFE